MKNMREMERYKFVAPDIRRFVDLVNAKREKDEVRRLDPSLPSDLDVGVEMDMVQELLSLIVDTSWDIVLHDLEDEGLEYDEKLVNERIMPDIQEGLDNLINWAVEAKRVVRGEEPKLSLTPEEK
jgi:hypothetical protein